jgi:hypothetical protein
VPASLTSSSEFRHQARVEAGDWQTPPALAHAAVAVVAHAGERFQAVLEPTCGTGAFLVAAARAFPGARLVGFDRSAEHVVAAARALGGDVLLEVADFFATDWERVIAELPEPLLVLGNPPWVTSSTLGAVAGTNLPQKSNFKRELGFDALTGKSNFDISEWMLTRLIEALSGRRFTLAMLCKSTVARRLLEQSVARGWALEGAVHAVDARVHFEAAVSAVLLVVRRDPAASDTTPSAPDARWAVFPSLTATSPASHMGVSGGRVHSDIDAHRATLELAGASRVEWRSGVKHDLARVMELVAEDGVLKNGLGDRVEIEPDFVYPLCKGSDLVHGRDAGRRFVLVTQQKLGEDTLAIRERAPATWRYLERHAAAFSARKSRIYRDRPPFAMFGVGPYTFAPHKVAISALHKQLTFRALAPSSGRPVLLDDTAYFLPCASAEEAATYERALMSPLACAFFEARVFWDAMRPINKGLLGELSLDTLLERLAAG